MNSEPAARLWMIYEQEMDRLRDIYSDTPAGYHSERERNLAAERIRLAEEAYLKTKQQEVSLPAVPKEPFAGRQKEISRIQDYFSKGGRILLLSGMGGIGKTALMTAFGRREAENGHRKVLFLPVRDGIRTAVLNDYLFQIAGMNWSPRRYRSQRSYFLKKLEALRKMAEKEKILLLLDDVKEIKLRELVPLLEIPADIILTSRLSVQAFSELPEQLLPAELPLQAMEEKEELEEMIRLLQPDITEEGRQSFSTYCRAVKGHTLALKLWLTAKGQLSVSVSEMAAFLRGSLNRREQLLLRAMTLLPASGSIRSWVEEMCTVPPEVTEALILRSLVQQQESGAGTQMISLHPLIAENVRKILKPDAKNCRAFLEQVSVNVGNAWNEPKETRIPRLPAVHSILTSLPDYPAWMPDVMDSMLTFLWVEEDFETSEKGYLRLFENTVKAYGEPSVKTGWMAVRTAAVYHNSGRYVEAEKWYTRGLENLRSSFPDTPAYWWQRMEACNKCTRGHLFRGETDEAIALLDEAEVLAEQAPEEARDEKFLLTETYLHRRRAEICLQLGRREEAEAARRAMHRVSETYAAAHGRSVPQELDLRETDIAFCLADSRLEEAEKMLKESLREYSRFRGPDHEDTLHCTQQLADVLCLLSEQAGAGSSRYSACRETARNLYLNAASGIRTHYPRETVWLREVEEKIRRL